MLIAIGLVVLLVPTPARADSAATTGVDADWIRVQSLQPGKPMRLILLQSPASPRSRKLKGVFHSATESSVTLLLRSGETRTVDRQAVRVVRVSRRARRRYGWIPGAATFAVMVAIVLSDPSLRDFTPAGRAGLPAVLSVPAWLLGYLLMPSMRVVYRMPKASGDKATAGR